MLFKRLVTALVLVAILLLALFVAPPWATYALIVALVLGGAWEWAGLIRLESTAARLAYVLLVAVASGGVWLLLHRYGVSLSSILFISALWWLVATVWVVVSPTPTPAALVALCGFCVLLPLAAALEALYDGLGYGPAWLLFVFLVVWAADTGAYFAGRGFGRHKLAPLVSPGKTWEGVVGGLVAAGLAGLAGAWYLQQPMFAFALLCLIAAAISVVGDLVVSMFKRRAGVKDSGSLFPGHGGILDRIDSVTAAAPVFLLGHAMLV